MSLIDWKDQHKAPPSVARISSLEWSPSSTSSWVQSSSTLWPKSVYDFNWILGAGCSLAASIISIITLSCNVSNNLTPSNLLTGQSRKHTYSKLSLLTQTLNLYVIDSNPKSVLIQMIIEFTRLLPLLTHNISTACKRVCWKLNYISI